MTSKMEIINDEEKKLKKRIKEENDSRCIVFLVGLFLCALVLPFDLILILLGVGLMLIGICGL